MRILPSPNIIVSRRYHYLREFTLTFTSFCPRDTAFARHSKPPFIQSQSKQQKINIVLVKVINKT